MPKKRWSALGSEEPEDLQSGFYDADKQGVPPAGTYSGVVKRLGIKENSNGDDMLNCVIEIKEPKGSDKARYNGYGIWANFNVTQQGAPYLKQFLQGLGVSWQDFLDRTVTESDDYPTKILKIGNVKMDGPEGVPCRFSAKRGKDYRDNTKDVLENPRLLKPQDDEPEQRWDDSADSSPSKSADAPSSTPDDDDPPF